MNSVPKSSGIYKITCTANGKFYVGSTDNFRRRWSVHLRELRGQYHHSIYLQRSFNKYGETSLTFEVLEFVMPFALIDREDYWLKKLHPFGDSGFNTSKQANAPMGGRKHTPEAKAKIAESSKGRKHLLGRKQSQDVIDKRVAKLIGRTCSQETSEKIRKANKGRKMSPEACANIGKSKKGVKPSILATQKSAESRQKSYFVTPPNGTEFQITNLRKFCRENGLDNTSLCSVAKGKYKHHRGWKCRPA